MSFINGDNKEKEEKEGREEEKEWKKAMRCGGSSGRFELPISHRGPQGRDSQEVGEG